MEGSFKLKVKRILEECAVDYLNNFVGRKYVVYSSNFIKNRYYTIDAKKDNYLHLSGVNTDLKPLVFFEKCINGSLKEDDFDIGDKSRKGSIRRKIGVLKIAVNLFDGTHEINVQEKFIKNNIVCSFATSDDKCTLGFILDRNSKPLTLLKGNVLDNPIPVELVFEKDFQNDTILNILLNKNNLSASEIQDLL